MIKFNIITLFPDQIKNYLKYPPFQKAIRKGLIKVKIINLRDYSSNSYKSVDDKPYGGGVGMIISIEPIFKSLRGNNIKKGKKKKIILLSPKGEKFNQNYAKTLLSQNEITLICGRYEGVDARIEHFCTDLVSIGDYILSGGETASLVILEAVTRLIPGVLEKREAVENESFEKGVYEYPQYTRPEKFGKYKVPKILLSGNHKEIDKWRSNKSDKINEK